MTQYRGGCHCGRIAFRVNAEIEGVEICNCSICHMKGYVHWYVPRDRFELLTPEDHFSTYRFNTRIARHHFCPICGVAPFYIPRSDPDKIDVNLRCVEGVDLAGIPVTTFDGRHWEEAHRSRRGRRENR